MDRKELMDVIDGYWRFARELVRLQGDLEQTLEIVGENCNFEAEVIVRGLHFAGIDPAAFWDFHNLIWNDLLVREQALPLTDLERRRLWSAMHRAWLPIMLFSDGESEPPDPIEEDILEVLGSVGCRLVTDELLSALASAGYKHGDSTVKARLARMVLEKKLVNAKKGGNRGYGLP